MKIRQKMAMLLAAAMAFTAIPAVTMAASDFRLTNQIIVKEKDSQLGKDAYLRIEAKSGDWTTGTNGTTPAAFFVNLTNSKWKNTAPDWTAISSTYSTDLGGTTTANLSATGTKGIFIRKNNDTELEVRAIDVASQPILIPLKNIEVTGGDATIAVDGNGTVIGDMAPVVFAKTSDKKATVSFGDAKNVYKEGSVADITIEEPLIGTISKKDAAGNTVPGEIKLTLENTDYQFVVTSDTKIEVSKGFSIFTTAQIATMVSGLTTNLTDNNTVTKITLPALSTSAPGRIKIKGLEVKLKSSKSFAEDDAIEVTVSGDEVTETTGKVAATKTLSCSVEMKDKKTVDIVAGKADKVEFTVFENVNDSMLDRTIEVRIDNAFLANGAFTGSATSSVPTDQTMKVKTKFANETPYSNPTSLTGFEWIRDKDNKVVGFDFVVPGGTSGVRKNEIDKITFSDVKVFVPVNKKGEVKFTVNGRAVGSELEVVAVNIVEPFEVSSEQFTVKVGLKEQLGGKLVIKETDKARFNQGENIVISVDDLNSTGFKFTDKPVVKVVDGNVKLDVDNIDKNSTGTQIIIPISRKSTQASTIEITNFKLKVDRTVPQGTYDLKITGKAIQPDCQMDELKVEKFVNVATANTEDLTTNNGLRKGTASFVIGSDKFVVNGVEVTMDAKAYLDPAGRTMVPLRFVANALGIEDSSIYYAQKTATIVAGSKTISVTLGDKVAKINGISAKVMDVAPTMANDRVYVPVGELANLLSVDATWDGATQTATFTVK